MDVSRMSAAAYMQADISAKAYMASPCYLLDEAYSMADTLADPPTYRALMRIKPDGMSPNAWSQQAGVSRMFFSDVKKGKQPRRDTLVKVLSIVGWTIERFEAESGLYPVQSEVIGAGAVGYNEMKQLVFGDTPLPSLPLFGSAQGADMEEDFETVEVDLGEVLDYLQRPVSLADDQDSYALTVVGSSMAPRFKQGERVGVSPRARVEIGDDVIVQMRGENSNRVRRVLIKELVRRSASHITLKQWNPERELQLARSDILSMHKVKGHFL